MSANDLSSCNIREKWIGLAEVVPITQHNEVDRSAYVNVIGLASDEWSFHELVEYECGQMGLQLTNLEDVEPWRIRVQNWHPSPDIISLANSVSDTTPIIFDTFFTFDE